MVSVSILVLIFIGASCSDDSTSPNNSPGTSQLSGTWDATEFSYTSVANSSLKEDLLQTLGMTIVMTVESNGHYKFTTTIQGNSNTVEGDFNEDGGNISSGDPNTTVTISGNTLTMVTQNVTWDFNDGNGQVPATQKTVFKKR